MTPRLVIKQWPHWCEAGVSIRMPSLHPWNRNIEVHARAFLLCTCTRAKDLPLIRHKYRIKTIMGSFNCNCGYISKTFPWKLILEQTRLFCGYSLTRYATNGLVGVSTIKSRYRQWKICCCVFTLSLKRRLNLEISCYCLADYVKEMYLSPCRTYSTISFSHSTNQIIVAVVFI